MRQRCADPFFGLTITLQAVSLGLGCQALVVMIMLSRIVSTPE